MVIWSGQHIGGEDYHKMNWGGGIIISFFKIQMVIWLWTETVNQVKMQKMFPAVAIGSDFDRYTKHITLLKLNDLCLTLRLLPFLASVITGKLKMKVTLLMAAEVAVKLTVNVTD